MAKSAEVIEYEALSLPRDERTKLVVHLLDSIDVRPGADPHAVEQAWLAEAHRRFQEFERGEVEVIPAEDIFAELRAEDS